MTSGHNAVLTVVFLASCSPSQSVEYTPLDVIIPCDALDDNWVDARVWWPTSARGGSTMPVVFRVGGASGEGYDIKFSTASLLLEDVAVIQHLPPASSAFGNDHDALAIECVVDWATNGPSEVPSMGILVLTGLSIGGNTVLNAVVGASLPVDGVVLWESPLVDQLVMLETSPGMMLDTAFVAGSCGLDDGCLFEGREARLGLETGSDRLFLDSNEDGSLDTDEPYYHRESSSTGFAYSRELTQLALAVHFSSRAVPENWTIGEDLDDFWQHKDATQALLSIRDAGSTVPFTYVAGRVDHQQLGHDHVDLAIEGLSGASSFLLNTGSANDDRDHLPTDDAAVLLLAAELAMVDSLLGNAR